MTMTSKTKKPRKKRVSRNELPEGIEAELKAIAKQNVGRPMSEVLQEGAPLKKLIGRLVELALQEEMAEHLGYEPFERMAAGEAITQDDLEEPPSSRRENTRNGYSSKTLKTSFGSTTIDIPRDRQASFEPKILPKGSTVAQQLEEQVLSMYARGMTTRDIRDHVVKLYGVEVSEMFVSRLVERLDPELSAWRNRPLDTVYASLLIDCIHQKIRHSHGVTSTALYQVCGYNEQGKLDVLGIYAAPADQSEKESATFWHQVLIEIEKRGVKDVLILSADGLPGLERAVKAVYPDTIFQPCVVHMTRNSLRLVAWKDRTTIGAALRDIYTAPSYEAAEQALVAFEESWGRCHPKIVKQWRENLPRLSHLWNFGEALRKLIYTTNAIENVNRQVRKVTKNRGVFPNVESALRLITMVHIERQEKIDKLKTRGDWKRIVLELHFLFGERLPPDWGLRYLNK
jgi:putative transposase